MASKNCIKCNKLKPLDEYHIRSRSKDGHNSKCKNCANREINDYIKTKKGIINNIYGNQCNSSIHRNHAMPDYTIAELRKWAFNQPIFHDLYDEWIASGYEKALSPSFDRTDDYQGYSLSRLKIMTWAENCQKGHDDIINGINNKINKSVIQSTREGVFIKNHYSQSQASRETGINRSDIWSCCNNRPRYSHAGGFKWRYSDCCLAEIEDEFELTEKGEENE